MRVREPARDSRNRKIALMSATDKATGRTKAAYRLPKSTSPYDTLSQSAVRDLITVVHYSLLFHHHLQLCQHELLFPHLEKSVLDAHGAAYEALVAHIYAFGDINSDATSSTDADETLDAPPVTDADGEDEKKRKPHDQDEDEDQDQALADYLTNETASTNDSTMSSADKLPVRQTKLQKFSSTLRGCDVSKRLKQISFFLSHCSTTCTNVRSVIIQDTDGRVCTAARLRSNNRDGSGTSYFWIRGTEGCASGRIVAGSHVWAGEDLQNVASILEARGLKNGSRLDTVTAAFLRDRYEVSKTRSQRVIDDYHEEERRKEQIELERQRKMKNSLGRIGVDDNGCVTLAGEKLVVGDFGRGRRERKSVSYAEQNITEGLEELGDDEVEEQDDDDDNEDIDYGAHEDEEDDEDDEEDDVGNTEIVKGSAIDLDMDSGVQKKRKQPVRIVFDDMDIDDEEDVKKEDADDFKIDDEDVDDKVDEDDEEYEDEDDTAVRRSSRLRGGQAEEPRAVGRRRVVSMDLEDVSSSRAARAARRKSLKT